MSNQQINIFVLLPGRIYFRPDDGCLWSEDQPEKILKMTNLPSRVLAHMLNSAGRVVSREELFNRIWEEQGLQPSGTALTQYVSQIRRALVELGAGEDIIATLPRVGFLISSEYVECTQVPIQKTTKDKIASGIKRNFFSYFVQPIFIINFFAFSSVLFSVNEFRTDVPEVIFGGESLLLGDCMVHYFSQKQETHHNFFTDRIKNFGDCSENTEFLVSADTKALKTGLGRIFMAYCDTDKNHSGGMLHGCISYYNYQN